MRKVLTVPHLITFVSYKVQLRLWTIFFLNFSSGLPFLLILSTLSVWLTEAGLSKTQIGIFAWVTIPYTMKFFLAPLIDHCKIPFFAQWLGQRRSWLLLSQLTLVLALIKLGSMQPCEEVFTTAIIAFIVGLCSAIQDIAVEAYRIEILDKAHQGAGATASVLGYRIGMLFAGAGAMYIAAYFHSWAVAYNIMALCMLIGIGSTLFAPEPVVMRICDKQQNNNTWLVNAVIKPLQSFFARGEWWLVILFIICYKFADTVLNVMSMPFLLEMGFDKIEIAHVAKTFGIAAMIFGGVIGGVLLTYYNLQRVLLMTIVLQLFASMLFFLQSRVGHNLPVLFITMGVENFACGLSQTALITYFSRLCLQSHAAVHYAILSSLASLTRVSFSMFAGWLADQVTWTVFYSMVCLSCIPGIVLLLYYMRYFIWFSQEKAQNKFKLDSNTEVV